VPTIKNKKKVLLIIMDGWGEGDHSRADAIWNANTPFVKGLYSNDAWAKAHLLCAGEAVGLPEGQMGNSEVGHLNIGGGRVVYQDLVKINIAIRDRSMEKNKTFLEAYSYAKAGNKAVHLIGLIGDGGVHSMSSHLLKLCDMAKDSGLEKVFVHAITDGRDTDPRSGLEFVKIVQDHLQHSAGRIASVVGRYYTMARDKRWERVKQGYDLMVHGIGKKFTNVLDAIQDSYDNGVTDEFIKPAVITGDHGEPLAKIQPGDVVICFNFRTDRLREITIALTQKDMPENGMSTMPLHYITMTRYDETFKNVRIAFDKEDLSMTLGEVLSKNGIKQIRIAETEKYPHVTFFFSGGREEVFDGESRILIQSPKVATYDLKPEMSAFEVKDAILPELRKAEAGFICMNFANADMVGHTGVYDAIIKALEAVDKCLEEVIGTAVGSGYSVILTADHGNADLTINSDGTPNTAHSLNPVPCFLFDKDFHHLDNGKLSDLAPTILTLMGIPIPEEMTGKVLVS
jgi:2,3-bisphosphoglycerate-independent phosphoglycerate mutase